MFSARLTGLVLALAPSAAFAGEAAEEVKPPEPLAVRYAGAPQQDRDAAAFAKLFKTWKAADRNPARADAVRPSASRRAVAATGRPARASAGSGTLTSGFGMRQHPLLGGERAHLGVDLAARTGTPVYATADGVVGTAGPRGGYGLAITLKHAAGMETRYGHLSRLNVVAGQRVRRGDLIGLVGSTGLSTGPHLHYETWVNGRPVNPLNYMGRK